jgi:hypothetical protein
MTEDVRSSQRYIPPPDCVHTRIVFGPIQRCRKPRCREWQQRVVAIWRSQQDWEPGTGAALRAHADVLRAL